MLTRPVLMLLSLCVAGSACATDEDSLDGSISAYYPLAFSDVRARLYDSELAIEYLQPDGESIVRITVRRAEKDPTGPGRIDLGEFGDITGSADGADLPDFVRGDLRLGEFAPKDRAQVSGSFDGLLASGNITLSIRGTFAARLDVVEGL